MGLPLNVVALISGGKDSFFSILHCIKNGHKVIALANLHPPTEAGRQADDIDSFMYQTIGHNVIPLYAEALGVPLYRQEIIGNAVNSKKAYGHQSSLQGGQDETESLVPLLRAVQQAHPHVNAVSSGAILSDYQRTRVESVATRLGLIPLSYLWQYPRLPPYMQTSLLDDMRAVGFESRIIKVASGGLSTEHLWLDLTAAATVQRLAKDLGRFGGLEVGAILGEGGEFETLAICGPSPIWKHQLCIRDSDRVISEGEGGGGSWAVKVFRASLQDLDALDQTALERLRMPPTHDTKFEAILEDLRGFKHDTNVASAASSTYTPMLLADTPGWQVRESATDVFISNMIPSVSNGDTASQTREVMDRLRGQLPELNLSKEHIALSIILLRSMSDFEDVNEIYKPFFDQPGPPARVTVACGDRLPQGVNAMISVIASKQSGGDRSHLHVQSQSYWAPANIGPYSQAVSVPVDEGAPGQKTSNLVYVAGQIPLQPASTQLIGDDFKQQAVLALQHLWRIGQALKVHWWTAGAIAFVPESPAEVAQERAVMVERAWQLAHSLERSREEAEDEDIAERSLYRRWAPAATNDLRTPHQYLPDWERTSEQVDVPPCFTIQVDQLPRSAQVEWWSAGQSLSEGRSCNVAGNWLFQATDDLKEVAQTLSKTHTHAQVFFAGAWSKELETAVMTASATIVPCRKIFSHSGHSHEMLIRVRLR